ncbi:purine-nucleoside phosphorylase [Pseudoalteromonas xiamenensis]|uniref:Purine nucleoside phosphorylase DeoD-type n=1 Tax=Pseudoalteromonas xiamenensis TaxID=882626 RepID=A0A975HJS7_9GAMM|nr:purine-nucleoside phosphorylase [Pseudoalteromonas xiamenensis]QTH70298.1 purine-nucleoside phosphorylase [Pseudoalteromonas xiamenensis]
MATPHIQAEVGAFADTVLLPGDPLRAKFIAETYLTDVTQVNAVRNMLGFTGYYKGKRVSVMGTGMGIPSCALYATELVTHFGVKQLIRVGSCGTVQDDIALGDIVIAMGASTDSKTNRMRFAGHDFAALADFSLLNQVVTTAQQHAIPIRVGNVFSSDLFYTPEPDMFDVIKRMGVLGIEMEAAGLYGVASFYGAKALTLLTVSDHITQDLHASAEARQKSFKQMIELALESA